jgi:hypothetical protein
LGCWVCSVVDKDGSMEAMIKNDEEESLVRVISRGPQTASSPAGSE